jgi:rhodanese-related sulfurtransferase
MTVSQLEEAMNGSDPPFVIDATIVGRWTNANVVKIPGAFPIPQGTLEENLSSIPRDRTIVIYAPDVITSDTEAAVDEAVDLLARGWTDVYLLAGGFDAWLAAGEPTEPK